MQKLIVLALFLTTLFWGCKPQKSTAVAFPVTNDATVPPVVADDAFETRIAFGSCANEDKPQPILEAAVRDRPNLFIYLGDNIYGDSDDINELRAKYNQLGAKPEFQHLRATTNILATWDDHDYGINDGGKYYAQKAASKDLFLEFWQEPASSTRRNHEGIYHEVEFGPAEKRIQVILLDTRTFRSNLTACKSKTCKNDYAFTESPDSAFLGEAQWTWLEAQLKKPAIFRIVASSNQFSHEYNGWESWTNVPREQERMFKLIGSTRAEGLVFISGDVHWGELSVRQPKGFYPIYDLTSSGITETWDKIEPNKYRVGAPQPANNYGLIRIEWAKDPVLTFELKNVDGKATVVQALPRSVLTFP
jgi:alkaline phosphatase D